MTPPSDIPAPPQPPGGTRIDRKALWIGAAIITVFYGLLIFLPPQIAMVRLVLLIAWIALYTHRLHDIGLSGWWQAPLYLAEAVAAAGMVYANLSLDLILAVIGLMQAGFTIWLGVVPGQPGDNRFGTPLNEMRRRKG